MNAYKIKTKRILINLDSFQNKIVSNHLTKHSPPKIIYNLLESVLN